MEPADIDWKNIESRFIRDETYEHINAPKWLDLSAPDSPSSAVDETWFCRPDCRHPKTPEDFLKLSPSPKLGPVRSNPQIMPLGERKSNVQRDANANNNLKRRGAIMSLLRPSSSPTREPAKIGKGNGKKFREDLENQDPNLLLGNSTGTSNQPMKTLKDSIKSGAEKRGVMNQEREEMKSKKPVPRLKSTLSARNLFSGRDILGRISDFCHEIKILAVGREKNSAAEGVAEEERNVFVAANSKGDEKVETEGENYKKRGDDNSVRKEVRGCPPTPQRFPSPSSRHLLNTNAANCTRSSLNKPLKPVAPERGILQDLNQGREEKRPLVAENKECNRVSYAVESEGSSMDMFWFLKPCT